MKGKPPNGELSAADLMFCTALLDPKNSQIDAYRISRPNTKCSYKSLCEHASKLAARHEIKAKLAELKQQVIVAPAIATRQEAALVVSAILRADPRKCFNEDGTLKAIKDLDDDTAIGITSFKDGEVKMERKLEAAKVVLGYHGDAPPTPDETEPLEELGSSYDWARRIAFTLEAGRRHKKLTSSSTD